MMPDIFMKPLQTIRDIDPGRKKDGIIIVGRGPSVDTLNLSQLNGQDKYDIFTINDAVKLVEKPKFSIHFHLQSVIRSMEEFDRAEHILLSSKCLWQCQKRREFALYDKLKSMKNVYFFFSGSRDFGFMISDDIPRVPEYRLYHYKGSISGVVYFAAGYMNYKKIRFIGFDGGTEYGQKVDDERKLSKIYHAQLNYLGSWLSAIAMLKVHYSDVNYKILDEFRDDQS